MEPAHNKRVTIFVQVRNEAWRQARIILPLAGFNAVLIVVQLVSVMFVGHLGTLELSSAAVATSLCNVSGFSVVIGLAYALDTLCGQAYGAKQYHELGIFVQRAVFVHGLVCIPISIFWFNLERVLVWRRQDPQISSAAEKYAKCLVPGLFAFAVFEPLLRFFQAQSKVVPILYASFAALLSHLLLCWIFISKLEMGNLGAAVALSLTYWLLVVYLLVAGRSSAKKCWNGFTSEALQDIPKFLKLAIPSALMVCLDWWGFEALVLLAGVLPNPVVQTSVISVIVGILNLWVIPSYGISAATGVITSNELGAGNPSGAKFAFRVSVLISVVYGAVATLVLILARNVLGPAFSSDGQVIDSVAGIIPVASLYVILAAFHSVGYGSVSDILDRAASGCGWQSIGAIGNIGAYYVVGLPLAYVLGFPAGFGTRGLLSGFLAGFFVQALVFFVVAFSTNWEKRSSEARERLGLLEEPVLQDHT